MDLIGTWISVLESKSGWVHWSRFFVFPRWNPHFKNQYLNSVTSRQKIQASQVAQMVKNLTAKMGDPGLIPGLGGSRGEGNGPSLQYSCLENFMDRGAWRATVQGVAKSWTQLSNTHTKVHPFHLHDMEQTGSLCFHRPLCRVRNSLTSFYSKG